MTTHRKGRIYRERCFRCGGDTFDNRDDLEKGKTTPVWRCKDTNCVDPDGNGYRTSEWSTDNPDKTGEPAPPPSRHDLHDDLPFGNEHRKNLWAQAVSNSEPAWNDLKDEEAIAKIRVAEFIDLSRHLK